MNMNIAILVGAVAGVPLGMLVVLKSPWWIIPLCADYLIVGLLVAKHGVK